MSLLARGVVLRQATQRTAPKLARSMHVENIVYHNMPFKYTNKAAFAVKLVTFFATGFSIPLIAARYQLYKASGGA